MLDGILLHGTYWCYSPNAFPTTLTATPISLRSALLTEYNSSDFGWKDVHVWEWEDGGGRAEGELCPGGSGDGGSGQLQVREIFKWMHVSKFQACGLKLEQNVV